MADLVSLPWKSLQVNAHKAGFETMVSERDVRRHIEDQVPHFFSDPSDKIFDQIVSKPSVEANIAHLVDMSSAEDAFAYRSTNPPSVVWLDTNLIDFEAVLQEALLCSIELQIQGLDLKRAFLSSQTKHTKVAPI